MNPTKKIYGSFDPIPVLKKLSENPDPLVSRKDLLKLLKVSNPTLNKMSQEGQMALPIRVGREDFYMRSSVIHAIQKRAEFFKNLQGSLRNPKEINR